MLVECHKIYILGKCGFTTFLGSFVCFLQNFTSGLLTCVTLMYIYFPDSADH